MKGKKEFKNSLQKGFQKKRVRVESSAKKKKGQIEKNKQKGVKKAAKAKQTLSTTTNLFKIIKMHTYIPLLISARCNYLCGKKKGENKEKHFNK